VFSGLTFIIEFPLAELTNRNAINGPAHKRLGSFKKVPDVSTFEQLDLGDCPATVGMTFSNGLVCFEDTFALIGADCLHYVESLILRY